MKFLSASLLAVCLLLCAASSASAATVVAPTPVEVPAVPSASAEGTTDLPIFGRKKTSNRKQRRFATKRSRRHGRGIMRARKSRGKHKERGGRRGGGGKKKEGCNT